MRTGMMPAAAAAVLMLSPGMRRDLWQLSDAARAGFKMIWTASVDERRERVGCIGGSIAGDTVFLVQVKLLPDGSFTGFVPVREGRNRVRVTALASDGSSGSADLELEFETSGLTERELALELERVRERNKQLMLLVERERIQRFRERQRKELEIEADSAESGGGAGAAE